MNVRASQTPEGGQPEEAAAEDRPSAASGVVERAPPPPSTPRPRRLRESEPPTYRPLTPYRARLDVEMDDTAISKVRDSSVSISLGVENADEPRPVRNGSREALLSIAIGVLVGALGVVLIAFVVRALGG